MLLGSFFSIVHSYSGPVGEIFEVTLLPSHPVYEGHFPGMPVVPGVCSLQMIKECAARTAGKALRFESISQCKYQALLVPGQHPQVTIELSLTPQEEQRYHLKATLKDSEQLFLSLKSTLTAL